MVVVFGSFVMLPNSNSLSFALVIMPCSIVDCGTGSLRALVLTVLVVCIAQQPMPSSEMVWYTNPERDAPHLQTPPAAQDTAADVDMQSVERMPERSEDGWTAVDLSLIHI